MDNPILLIFLLVGGLGVVSQFFVTRSRQKKSYKNFLEPILVDCNLEFVSSTFPGWFKVGPFPKTEIEFGRPQTEVPFLGRGEYCQYRLVEVRNSQGDTFQLWAKLDFERFSLRMIRWRVFPDDSFPDDSFPDEAKTFLENLDPPGL